MNIFLAIYLLVSVIFFTIGYIIDKDTRHNYDLIYEHTNPIVYIIIITLSMLLMPVVLLYLIFGGKKDV